MTGPFTKNSSEDPRHNEDEETKLAAVTKALTVEREAFTKSNILAPSEKIRAPATI